MRQGFKGWFRHPFCKVARVGIILRAPDVIWNHSVPALFDARIRHLELEIFQAARLWRSVLSRWREAAGRKARQHVSLLFIEAWGILHLPTAHFMQGRIMLLHLDHLSATCASPESPERIPLMEAEIGSSDRFARFLAARPRLPGRESFGLAAKLSRFGLV